MDFDNIFKESKIFDNREVLSPHYLPDELPFRDKQINEIIKSLTPALRGERGRNLFIYGKTGTGKTSCIKYVINKITQLNEIKARVSYINCRIYNSRFRVFNKIASDHLPLYSKRGFGVIDIYEKLINFIEVDGKTLIVVLDEIDMIKDLDDTIYTLTRINSDISKGGITIVGISNKISFKDNLDPRSLSTLYENEIVFPPYNSEELSFILKARATKAFKPNVIDDGIINFVSAIAAKESGDARLALKILSKAGEIADEKDQDKITQDDVVEAAKYAEEDIAYELISTLPEQERLILYAIATLAIEGSKYKRLTSDNEDYVLSGEIYDRYVRIAQSMGKEPKSDRWYRKFIVDLEMQGLITSMPSSKGIKGHTKLIKLLYPADKVKTVLDKGFGA